MASDLFVFFIPISKLFMAISLFNNFLILSFISLQCKPAFIVCVINIQLNSTHHTISRTIFKRAESETRKCNFPLPPHSAGVDTPIEIITVIENLMDFGRGGGANFLPPFLGGLQNFSNTSSDFMNTLKSGNLFCAFFSLFLFFFSDKKVFPEECNVEI